MDGGIKNIESGEVRRKVKVVLVVSGSGCGGRRWGGFCLAGSGHGACGATVLGFGRCRRLSLVVDGSAALLLPAGGVDRGRVAGQRSGESRKWMIHSRSIGVDNKKISFFHRP